MIVRKIESSDIGPCAALFAEVFREAPWNEPWSQQNAKERLAHIYDSKGFVGFLIEKKNNIIGIVLGNVEPFAGGDAFYLREMCIMKEEQGKEYGKKLVACLHSELAAQKIARSYLITRRNGLAATFYLANGYNYEEHEVIYEASINL